MYTYTNQKQIRAAFWEQHRGPARKPGGHNEQHVDTRVQFAWFVDALERDGQISEALAQRVTL